jgi:hypothetical protein
MALPHSYCAYLELFGGRHLAHTGSRQLEAHLAKFQDEVAQQSPALYRKGAVGHVYYFAATAFAECSRLGPLSEYLRRVRLELAKGGIFFKGALAHGPFLAFHPAWLEMERSSRQAPSRLATSPKPQWPISGAAFRGESTRLLAACENLKAIGLSVQASVDGPAASTIANCFVAPDRTSGYTVFRDLAFGDELAGDEQTARLVLEKFLEAFYVARSRKPARHFPPFLRTWIDAVDFTLCGDRKSLAHRIISLAVEGEFERLYGAVAGAEGVYLALLARLRRQDDHAARRQLGNLKTFIRGHQKLLRRILELPVELDPDSVRDELLAEFSREFVHGAESVRVAEELVGRHAPDCWTAGELAVMLQDAGAKNPLGAARWTAGTVQSFMRRYRVKSVIGERRYKASVEALRKLASEKKALGDVADDLNSRKLFSWGGRRWTSASVRAVLEA